MLAPSEKRHGSVRQSRLKGEPHPLLSTAYEAGCLCLWMAASPKFVCLLNIARMNTSRDSDRGKCCPFFLAKKNGREKTVTDRGSYNLKPLQLCNLTTQYRWNPSDVLQHDFSRTYVGEGIAHRDERFIFLKASFKEAFYDSG